MITSCKDCKDRTPTCHIDCDRYRKSKEEYDELKKLIKKETELDRYKTRKKNNYRDKYLKKYGRSY